MPSTSSNIWIHNFMNTLTPNRILQAGDEYIKGGEWKPVPQADFGLQIMFTKYQQVRRPSEEPAKNLNAAPVLAEARLTAKAGGDCGEAREGANQSNQNSSLKKDSRGGVQTPTKLPIIVEGVPFHPDKVKNLPTVVSAKAHPETTLRAIDNKECLPADHPLKKPSPIPTTPNGTIEIGFLNPLPDCIWTGRNGTFHGRAINLTAMGDHIQIVPVGKRGMGNCLIEFPASIIPQLTDWLLRHQLPTTTTPKGNNK
jgi:hypothetical protein